MSARKKPTQRERAQASAEAMEILGNPLVEAERARVKRVGALPGAQGQEAYNPDHITRAKVSLWASMGITQEIIADLLTISEDTLKAHFRKELNDGGASAVGKVSAGLFDKAMSGDVTSMIFFLKTRGKWSEKPSVGDKDNPLVIEGKNYSPADVAVALARKLRDDRSIIPPSATDTSSSATLQ